MKEKEKEVEKKITPMAEKYMKSKSYKETKIDLLTQLEINLALGKYYIDLVESFMNMWVTEKLLSDDIKKRGVNTEWDNGGGQKGIKSNDSVEKQIKVMAQMIKTLDWLNLKPPEMSVGEPNDPDEEM